MPAPVNKTVLDSDGDLEDLGVERKLQSACTAPAGVLAFRGIIVGGGKGPV